MFFINAVTATEKVIFTFGVQTNHHYMLFQMRVFMAKSVQRIERSIIHQIYMYIYDNKRNMGKLHIMKIMNS